MFRKVNVPVLGVVENMATHTCSNCGHEEHVFGAGGGERIALDYQTQLLGSLPLSLNIRQDADAGKPTVAVDADSDISLIYRDIARKLVAAVDHSGAPVMPEILVSDD